VFCQPRLVGCDPRFLATLSPRDSRGARRVAKAAWIGDPALLTLIEGPAARLSHAALPEIVRRAIAVKARVVARDEHGRPARAPR
jgi:3-dehydroquinate synthase